MRILHIYDHTEPHHSGYVFRSRSLRMALERSGKKCDILSMPRHFADKTKILPYQETEMIDEKLYYRSKPTKTRIPILRELTDIKNAALLIKKCLIQNQYDYIHVHSPVLGVFSAMLARFLTRQKHIKIVYEIRAFWEDAAVDHGTLTENSLKYKIIHALETFGCHFVDHVYPICQPLKQDLIDRNIDSKKITIIPNVLTENAFQEIAPHQLQLYESLKQHHNFQESDYILGFIGSFYAYEGLEDLMPIMHYFKKMNYPVKLLLVGQGLTFDNIKAYCQEHDLDNIIMAGRVPHEHVALYYKLCHAMIYPRRSMRLTETVTPLKPLEAAAAKVPVILSNIGGHRELLQDKETGFFIDNFSDADNVSEQIWQILQDKENLRNIADNAYHYVMKNNSADEIIKKYYRF